MKQWLFTPKINRFDVITMIAYFAALKHIDFGLNVPTVFVVGTFVVATIFSAEMEGEVREKTVSKKAR